jgi:hypothetical protein
MSVGSCDLHRGGGGASLDEGKTALVLEDVAMGAAANMKFMESIYSPYRYGSLSLLDVGPIMELTTLFTTTEDDRMFITLKNAMDTGDGVKVPVGLYNSEFEPAERQDLMQKNLKEIKYEIAEEPFFRKMLESPVRKAYVNMTAAEMIKDILETHVFTGNDAPTIEIRLEGEDKPVIKNFISPYWKVRKVIDYLVERHEKGPLVVFPYTEDGETLIVITTLDSLSKGVLGEGAEIAVRIQSEISEGNIMRPDYRIKGPSLSARYEGIQGSTVVAFNYFAGSKQDYGKDIGDEDSKAKAKYSFEEGVDEYQDSEDRYGKSFVSGIYKEGVEQYGDGLLGNYGFYKEEEQSRPDNKVVVDLDDRPEIEAKMRSRFYRYMHDQLVCEATLIPHAGISIGKIYQINFPSSKKTIGDEPDYNETISGKWLLVQITHSTFKREQDDALQYVIIGTFVRAGLEVQHHEALSGETLGSK